MPGPRSRSRGLYRRENSPFWWISYAGPDGRIIRESTKTSSKKLAKSILNERRASIARGEFLGLREQPRLTFRKLCDKYLEWSKARKTKASYERDVGLINNLCSDFGNASATRVTRADIDSYRKWRREEVSGATVNREAACLRAVFNKAILWNLVDKNPASNLDMFPEEPRVRYLKEEEQRRLLESCRQSDQPLLYPIVALAMLSGLRRGELLALKWGHIDFHRKMIVVEHAKGHKARHVPLCPQALEVLGELTRGNEDDLLFPVTSVKKSFATALKRAEITNLRFHDLRHCFASSLAAQGIDLLSIKELLGHTTMQMSLRYSHLSDRKLRDAVCSLPDILPGKGSSQEAEGASRVKKGAH